MKKKLTSILILLLIFCTVQTSDIIYAKDLINTNNLTKYEDPYDESANRYNNASYAISKSETGVYRDIHNALVNLEDKIDLSKYSLSSSEVFKVREKVLNDYPEIIYFNHEGSMYWSNGLLEFKYITTKEKVKEMKIQLNNKVQEVLNSVISKNMTDIEKEIAIHDYLVLNTAYDSYNYNRGTIPQESYNAYGVLIKKTGVCQGYSESMKILLNRLGIECTIVSSRQMNHAWNIVKIDGQYYHLDVTWDDPVPDIKNYVRYQYFNLSDRQMSKDHQWDKGEYPSCNSERYSYLHKINSQQEQKILVNAVKTVELAEKNITKANYDKAIEVVNKLQNAQEKNNLLDRLKVVKAGIGNSNSDKEDKQKLQDAINNAIKAVVTSENTQDQKNVDAAKKLIDKLPNGKDKDDLKKRIANVQKKISDKKEKEKENKDFEDKINNVEFTLDNDQINKLRYEANRLKDEQSKYEILKKINKIEEKKNRIMNDYRLRKNYEESMSCKTLQKYFKDTATRKVFAIKFNKEVNKDFADSNNIYILDVDTFEKIDAKIDVKNKIVNISSNRMEKGKKYIIVISGGLKSKGNKSLKSPIKVLLNTSGI